MSVIRCGPESLQRDGGSLEELQQDYPHTSQAYNTLIKHEIGVDDTHIKQEVDKDPLIIQPRTVYQTAVADNVPIEWEVEACGTLIKEESDTSPVTESWTTSRSQLHTARAVYIPIEWEVGADDSHIKKEVDIDPPVTETLSCSQLHTAYDVPVKCEVEVEGTSITYVKEDLDIGQIVSQPTTMSEKATSAQGQSRSVNADWTSTPLHSEQMGKSRAEYMRDYRQKKREEKIKTGKVGPKKIEMGKSRAEYMRGYRQKKRKEKLKTGKAGPKKTKMDKSRAEYMRDYRQKKREEKLKTGKVERKTIAHNSTQRSRDIRARAANSILSQTSTADPTTALPDLVDSHPTSRLPSLPSSHIPSTSTASACNTGPMEIHTRPADVKQERVLREDVEQVEHDANNSITLLIGPTSSKSISEEPGSSKCSLVSDVRTTQVSKECDFGDKCNEMNKKLFECDRCEYSASQRGNLQRHMRVHTGVKPYTCGHCDYSASLRTSLQTHMRLHTGEKPYKCKDCDYSATAHNALKTHMRKHTGEKPYKCKRCDYMASQHSHLQKHIRTHTGEKPYKCKHCDFSTTAPSNLNRHIYTHSKEKPYKCTHCDYSTSLNSRLQTHIMRKHTGE